MEGQIFFLLLEKLMIKTNYGNNRWYTVGSFTMHLFNLYRVSIAGEWVTIEGKFKCVSLTCMSSSCPRSPTGLSPSAHLADGTADLILVRETNPLGFLTYLHRHTTTQDQVKPCDLFFVLLVLNLRLTVESIISV